MFRFLILCLTVASGPLALAATGVEDFKPPVQSVPIDTINTIVVETKQPEPRAEHEPDAITATSTGLPVVKQQPVTTAPVLHRVSLTKIKDSPLSMTQKF